MSWQHVSDAKTVARKPHECGLCGLPIEAGSTYINRRGFDDDGPVSFRMHAECEAVTQSWELQDWETGWDPIDFRFEMERKRMAHRL